MHQIYNKHIYSTEFNTIYIIYIILYMKKTMDMDIQLKFNTLFLNIWHCEKNNMDIQNEVQCNIYWIHNIVYQRDNKHGYST